jgi:hypothetical protein
MSILYEYKELVQTEIAACQVKDIWSVYSKVNGKAIPVRGRGGQ